MKKLILLITTILFSGASVFSQSIVGKWETIDDDTNKPRSVVEIYEENGKYFGKIIDVYWDKSKGEDAEDVCEKCTDDRKNKKILGLQIIRKLEKKGNELKNGTILDPNNGKVYDCKIWVENGELKVRGYVAFFFRTQTWKKFE